MLAILTPAEMRAVDERAAESTDELIRRAGWHLAFHARQMMGGVYGRRVAVVAGPGNNGADARVAAGLLQQWGCIVEIFPIDVDRLPHCDLVIDGALGTGNNRPYSAPDLTGTPAVLAVDIPSGVDALTGELCGSARPAGRTVTFASLKPGLLLGAGARLAGEVRVADIGLDTSVASAHLFEVSDAIRLLPRRDAHDHKWRRAVWVIGGTAGMHGAPLLASRAALRSGSGLVWCAIPGALPPAVGDEVVLRDLSTADWAPVVQQSADRFGALVIGPGMGRSNHAENAVRSLVKELSLPLVVDADGLRALDPAQALRPGVVLTPHDGEFEALTGSRPGPDRFAAARKLASQRNATVLLKGPLTVVASPEGRCLAVDHGDERLATAGTGDVLAGVIGSYLAAGIEPLRAAALGAWMHAEAARSQPRFGMVASDLLAGLAAATSQLLSPKDDRETDATY